MPRNLEFQERLDDRLRIVRWRTRQGDSAAAIALRLGVSQRTVERDRRLLRKRENFGRVADKGAA